MTKTSIILCEEICHYAFTMVVVVANNNKIVSIILQTHFSVNTFYLNSSVWKLLYIILKQLGDSEVNCFM